MISDIPSIKIFSIDYKTIENAWNLPYIRLGTGKLHNAVISDSARENLLQYDLELSEGTAIWWIWKHLAEFGKTDYIGFCHYRRFFSQYIHNPVVDISKDKFDPKYCLTPEQQLQIMLNGNYDIIAPYPLLGFDPNSIPFNYIWESFKIQSSICDWGLTDRACKLPFELLLENADENLKQPLMNSFKKKPVHFCSIFTCKKSVFDLYCRHIFPTCIKMLEKISFDERLDFHPRWAGCVLERLTSCMIYALQEVGCKVLNMPLLTVATNDTRPFDHKKIRDLQNKS